MSRPPFLEVVVRDVAAEPGLTGICAGFERGAWRRTQLARRLLEAIPMFALTHEERQTFRDETAVELMGRAVRSVYTTEKYQRRGEFGEILLYVALTELFNTVPAISKIFFKDSSNDTVKGFDAVHVVEEPGGELELWLGEVKFYEDVASAIRDVVAELHAHFESDFLRSEFAAIGGKLEPTWEHSPAIKALLDRRTTLDAVFERLTVPVLLTYDSRAVSRRVRDHASGDKNLADIAREYQAAVEAEYRAAWSKFTEADPPSAVRILLILLPLHVKKELLSVLDERLKAWQVATED